MANNQTPSLEEFIEAEIIDCGTGVISPKSGYSKQERSEMKKFYDLMLGGYHSDYEVFHPVFSGSHNTIKSLVNKIKDVYDNRFGKNGLVQAGNFSRATGPIPMPTDCCNLIVKVIMGYMQKNHSTKHKKKEPKAMFRGKYPVYDIDTPEEAEQRKGSLYMLRGGPSKESALKNLDNGLKVKGPLDPKDKYEIFVYETGTRYEAMMKKV